MNILLFMKTLSILSRRNVKAFPVELDEIVAVAEAGQRGDPVDGEIGLFEQKAGVLYAEFQQILDRSGVEFSPEAAQKLIFRHAGEPGEAIQSKRFAVVGVHVVRGFSEARIGAFDLRSPCLCQQDQKHTEEGSKLDLPFRTEGAPVNLKHPFQQIPDIVEQNSAQLKRAAAGVGEKQSFPVVQEREIHSHCPEEIRRTGDVADLALFCFQKTMHTSRADDGDAARIDIPALSVENLDRRAGENQNNFNARVPVLRSVVVQEMVCHIKQYFVDAFRRTVNRHGKLSYSGKS